jgi:hypothetical protein
VVVRGFRRRLIWLAMTQAGKRHAGLMDSQIRWTEYSKRTVTAKAEGLLEQAVGTGRTAMSHGLRYEFALRPKAVPVAP